MAVLPVRLVAVVALLGAGVGSRLAGQEPDARAAIEQLRDSLAGATDSLSLRRLEAATIEAARRDRDNPLMHLRLGFIAYRLGDLARSKSHYDDAAGEFEWATELRPAWPYPWYGLGLAELAQGEHSAIAIENLKQQLGLDYLSKAARAFAHATQVDPGFAFAVIDLATAALNQRIRPRLEVALQAVRLAAASPAGAVPAVQLARGRVERAVGEADSAVVAFRAYLAVGGDSGIALFELARSLFLASRPQAGESSYYAGARVATSAAARELYRHDAAYLADSVEMAAFDTIADPAGRATWLAQFWNRRDVEEARDAGERLAEHNRRWFYAQRNFRLVSRHRHYDITEVYRPSQAELDDRGVIYLRHGEPDDRALSISDPQCTPTDTRCVEPNQSWLYHRPTGDLVFHFVARDDASDYKLVESLVDAMGFRAAVQAAGHPDQKVIDLYASREQFGGTYARVARGGAMAGAALADERAAGRHTIATGTTTDSYTQHFPVTLDLVAHDFVAGAGTRAVPPAAARPAGGAGGDAPVAADAGAGETGGTGGQALHVVFAIPADRLAPEPGGEGVLYPLHFRLLVSDLHDSLVARLDTVRVFTARQTLHAPSFLSGRLSLPLPPGRYRYRLLVTTTDQLAGQLMVRDTLDVQPLDGRAFTVSDLVLGRAGAGLVWLPPRDTVLLDPLGRFPSGSVAELYYEVYGLAPGATYHTEVRLERQGGRSLFSAIGGLFGGRRPPVLLDFDTPADGPATRVHRGVSLRGVAAGTYQLTVTLSDPATGRRVSQRQTLQVVAAP